MKMIWVSSWINLFNIAIPPGLPVDLKAKKINLKEAKAKLSPQELGKKVRDIKDLFEEIEDVLYDEGLIDLEDDPEDD